MEVKVCPECGKHNSTIAWNCIDCGETLSAETLMDKDSGQFLSEIKDKEKEFINSGTNTLEYYKVVDLAYGFFGCLVIWNFLGVLAFFTLGVVGAVMLELIGLAIPFVLNKKWIGYGAVSYVITNTIVLGVWAGELTLYGAIVPFGALFFSQ